MQFKKTQGLLSLVTFLAWSSAQGQVIWKADSETCTKKPSGAYAECKPVNAPIDLIENVFPTENSFIKAQTFVTNYTYVYACAGREDETYLQFNDIKHQAKFGTAEVSNTFIHGYNPTAKVNFIRNSRGFSTVSSSCSLEIKSADTAISSVESLREYVKRGVGALRKLTSAFTKLTTAADVTVVQNALFDINTQVTNELNSLNTKKGDLELDLDFAESDVQKAEIQAKIDALLPKISDVSASKGKVDAALAKLAVSCSQPEGGVGSPVCQNFLTATVSELTGLNSYFSDELKTEILPWINGEITRLDAKQEAIKTSLGQLKSIIESV